MKKIEKEIHGIYTYGNENMDLAVRAAEIPTQRISKDDEQPPTAVLMWVDA